MISARYDSVISVQVYTSLPLIPTRLRGLMFDAAEHIYIYSIIHHYQGPEFLPLEFIEICAILCPKKS